MPKHPSGISAATKSLMGFSDAALPTHPLTYIFDTSYSMNDRMIGVEDGAELILSSGDLDLIQNRIENARTRIEAEARSFIFGAPDNPDDDIRGAIAVPHAIPNEDAKRDVIWTHLTGLTPEALARQVVQRDLLEELGLKRMRSLRSKFDVVRRYGVRMIEERFSKFPEADIRMVTFDEEPTIHAVSGKAQILKVLERAEPYGGGTNILPALQAGLNLRKAARLENNQVILVTDALDHNVTAESLSDIAAGYLACRITLDFIHVVSAGDLDGDELPAWQHLKSFCESTGGRYSQVDKASSLRDTFVEASRRLLLTAGGSRG